MMNEKGRLDLTQPISFKITDVKLRIVDDGRDGLLAWASCVVSGAIKLENIAIRRGKDGDIFLTYPNKVSASGIRHPFYHPVNTQAAEALQDAVLARLSVLAKTAFEGGSQT